MSLRSVKRIIQVQPRLRPEKRTSRQTASGQVVGQEQMNGVNKENDCTARLEKSKSLVIYNEKGACDVFNQHH